jgi:hypothetical protein
MVYPTQAQVSIAGEENTKDYRFGRKYTAHHFCKICGIPLYMRIHRPEKEIFDTWPEARKEVARKNFDLLPVNLKVE